MDQDASAAVARLCRQYVAFLESTTVDSLFNWSNALHSMHDRVPQGMRSALFKSPEFVAMKALRNHFHHSGEVAHRIKPLAIGNLPLMSDLGIVCLIDRGAAEAAIQAIGPKFKTTEQPMIEAALKWYGPCVNLYPAIFNLMAQVVLLAQDHHVMPDDEAFKRLVRAIRQDKANGHRVTVTGDIYSHAASVDQVLAGLMAK